MGETGAWSGVWLAYWVHDLNPVVLRITDTLAIRWYGLSYVAGFVAGFWLLGLYRRRRRSPLNREQEEFLFPWLIGGVVVGGRLGYFLFYRPLDLLADPLILFRTWEGGMASHGGFIGVFLALLWFVRRQRLSIFRVGDLLATMAPPGFFFGRMANFINGELWGKPTSSAWGVLFPNAPWDPAQPSVFVEAWGRMANPRHPSQIYEALLEGLILIIWTQWRFWRGGKGRTPGRLAGEFIIGYALVRIIGEHFREPDAPLIGDLNRGAFYSIFMILAGAWLLFRRSRESELTGSSPVDSK